MSKKSRHGPKYRNLFARRGVIYYEGVVRRKVGALGVSRCPAGCGDFCGIDGWPRANQQTISGSCPE